jgi:hypothetical protein
MPILRQHHMAKAAGEPIDRRNNFVAFGNGKLAARTEVVLDVDHQEDVALFNLNRHLHSAAVQTSSAEVRWSMRAL